jgi:peptidoglycan/LPS O-acetylase OafA/YrhL
MGTKPSNKERLFGPDLIRALAIVLVLASHTLPGGTEYPILGVARYYLGFLGVEIFFVLSGFLIGGILLDELYSDRLAEISGILSFWKRRWFRTLPNYYLFLLIAIFLDRLSLGKFPDAGRYFWFGQALYYPTPTFFTLAWSLSIEEWFYLLFPLALFVFAKLLKSPPAAVLSVIVIFIVTPVILRFFLPATANWTMGVKAVTLPRLDAIAYGVVLAFTKRVHPGIWRVLTKFSPVGMIAVLGLFGHFCHFGYVTSDSIFYRVFYFCIVSSCLALAFPRILDLTEPAGRWKVIFKKLSLWSYSIYLSQTPVIGIVDLALKHLGVGYFQAHIDRCILTWLLCIPLSALVYRVFEKPLMDLRDRPMKSIFPKLAWKTVEG